MRDLHKILKLFSEDYDMDYCEEFDYIKSVILHCHKRVKPINRIQFRGGNEQFINEITRRLQQVLVERNLVDSETLDPLPNAHQTLRKVLMYLFANTDTTYKYNLAEDPNFANILEQCPLVAKFLLITLVWELKLDQYFYEALCYTPCWFAFQYFEPASDSLKYIDDPYIVLEKVEQLMRSLCICIARSEHRQIDKVDKRNIYNKLYDYSINLLRQFYTPDAEKFKEYSTEDYSRYSGFVLKHISQLVIFAFDLYEYPEKTKPEIKINIYEICESLCKKVEPQDTLLPSQELKEQLLKIIKALLNSLQYNVMLVSVSSFMSWADCDLTPNLTLQAVVGETVYNIEQRMLANPLFAHDGLQHLKSIAIRPKSLEEIIKEATNGEILHKLADKLCTSEKKKWFDELFNRWTALGNDECLETIHENMELMTIENCKQVLDFLKESIQLSQIKKNEQGIKEEEIDVDIGEYETLLSVLYDGLQNLKEDDILELIAYQTKNFDIFFQRKDYDERVTAFLNKFAKTFDYKNFLILCFENPPRMWAAFFDNACHDLTHVRNFCAIVKKARPLSNMYFCNKFESAMRDPSKLAQKNFPHLLCEIYFVLYYPNGKTEFLKSIMNKYVNEFLDVNAFGQILPIVKSLNLITCHEESYSHKPLNFGEVTAPVLLMAGLIMDKARWDLISYTEERDELLRDCIQFIRETAKRFLPVATAKDRKWIACKVKESYRTFTQYYFEKFSLKPDEPQTDFDRFLMRAECENELDAQMFLIKNYIRCTKKETEWLARSERLLPHISEVMILLGGFVAEADNTNAINNYRHCLFNYTNIVQKFLLPPIVNDKNATGKLIMTILKIIQAAPEQIYEDSFTSISPLVMEIMNVCACPLRKDSEIVQSVQNFISTMNDCPGKGSFMAKLANLPID